MEQNQALFGNIPGYQMPDMQAMQEQLMAQMKAAVPGWDEIQQRQAEQLAAAGIDAGTLTQAFSQNMAYAREMAAALNEEDGTDANPWFEIPDDEWEINRKATSELDDGQLRLLALGAPMLVYNGERVNTIDCESDIETVQNTLESWWGVVDHDSTFGIVKWLLEEGHHADADRLLQYYEEHPAFILPLSRKNEMVNNFLKPGLQDLCVSRTSFTWGIPVGFDPKHVVYVWLDALTNYITGLGYDADGDPDALFAKYWPADVHVIGKDIIRFHTIYWPIFLMALGLPLPKQVFGHPWLLMDGNKMSKSRGNVIYADELVQVFGVDAVRYFVLSEMPFDNDGNITWERINDRVNADLANTYGNLVSRTAAMARRYFGGELRDAGAAEPMDAELKAAAVSLCGKVTARMDEFKVSDALGEIFSFLRRCNKYIDETAPWLLAKDPEKKDRLATVLYNLAESVVIASSLLRPFIPDAAEKALRTFSCPPRAYADLGTFGLLPPGAKAEDLGHLFRRQSYREVEAQYAAMHPEHAAEPKPAPAAEPKPAKAEGKGHAAPAYPAAISIDDFAKVRMQVGEVVASERVKKSEKLLKNTVKIGSETRTVVSGIAKFYSPEEMVGKKVVVVTNLKPAKLCGILSEGMILCAEDAAGDLSLLSPEKAMESGSGIY